MSNEHHKYDYKATLIPDGASARIFRMVGKHKRVIEIGSGPGSITKFLATTSQCRVTAIDIDAESVNKVAPFCERAFQADLNDADWPKVLESDNKFEVVVAADVLEHIYEPSMVLQSMKELLSENGYMVLSLPHVGHSVIHACLLDENFDYSDTGLLDRTHIRFFGIKNMQQLFEDAGMKIIHAEFVVRNPEHTEFSKLWAKTSKELRDVLAKNPFGLVYQVIVKVVPNTAEGSAISLISMAVPPQVPSFIGSLRAILRRYLSKGLYSKLLNVYKKYF